MNLKFLDNVSNNSTYPTYDSVKNIISGKTLWRDQEVSPPDSMVDWLNSTNNVIMRLDRYDLLTLYAYTTQEYPVILSFLRRTNIWLDTTKNRMSPYDQVLEAANILLACKPNNLRSYFRKTIPQRIIDDFVRLKKRKIKSEDESKDIWKKVRELTAQNQDFFNQRLWRDSRNRYTKRNDGILYYSQIQKHLNVRDRSVDEISRLLPNINFGSWKNIISMFVKDLDIIFEKMPEIHDVFQLYRGVSNIKKTILSVQDSYLSTTYNPKTAMEFVDKQSRCCLIKINVNPGSKLLPLLFVSRYNEQEILLPRQLSFSYEKISKKSL